MKKIVTFLLAAIMAFAAVSVTAGAAYRARSGKSGYSPYWEYWSQGGSSYTIMRNVGCRTVAYSKLLAETGFAPSNPDEIYWYNRNNGYVTSGYAEYNAHTGKIPEYYTNGKVSFEGKVKLDKSSKAKGAAQIMHYINQGYYVMLAGPTHTTYVLRDASIKAGTALISDSWGSWAYSEYANKIKYTKYNYTSFTNIWLYKVNSASAPESSGCIDPGYEIIVSMEYYVKGTDGALAINSVPRSGNMIGSIPEGARCTVVETASKGNWMYVNYNGVEGYCYGKYLTKETPATHNGRISGTDGALAINSIPKSGNMIGSIPEGAVCTVYDNIRSGKWVWVEFNNVYGYAYSKYIK